MEALTKRQREVIEFIVQFTFEHLYQPTFKEIGQHCSIASTNGVNDHIKALHRKGYLRKGPDNRHAFEFTDKALGLVKDTGRLRARPIRREVEPAHEVPGY
jgi:repressor LexA